ncbi:MAG: helix-turn-helix domain-containing protein [bacterium]|nr:helix-turn-helix domain-containing protein [bacterium]
MPDQPTTTSPQQDLLSATRSDVIVVSGLCTLYEEDGLRVAVVGGIPVYRYHRDDRVAGDLFIALARVGEWATPTELASALGVSLSTVHRCRRKYVEGGARALERKRLGAPRKPIEAARAEALRTWHAEGVAGREMARRLRVAPGTVQRQLERLGLRARVPRTGRQQALALPDSGLEEDDDPGEPEAASPQPATPVGASLPPPVLNGQRTLDTDPLDRQVDRMLALRGKLLDATPFFAPGTSLPRLGVLLALPMIVATGLLPEAKAVYGHIGPAFYGLRTSLLAMVLLALLRVKHPENLKEYSPPELGRLLGLDRAPEVKTLRRKLARLAAGPVDALLERLTARRVRARGEALGFLYVDGHVRVYNGQAKLPKTHVARMRISLPATQEMWVNDAEGDPLFFVTQEGHPSLVSALGPILENVRHLVGDRRVTVVFDRGGWSPKLFERMVADGFDVLTYRKGKSDPVPDHCFAQHPVPGTAGRSHWELAELGVRVGTGFWMRQVTRRRGEHQTHIVTSRHDLSITELAHRMFNRWRQENFFKYMRQEFAIDALVEYGEALGDPERDVPNPEWTALNKLLRKARLEVKKLEAEYGAAAIDNPERKRPTMRGFKIAHGSAIGIPLRHAREHVEATKVQRDALPSRCRVAELAHPPAVLPGARKRISDALKMLAYQVESDLVRVIAPHYQRAEDEGRTLIASALQSSGDLDVVGDELRITLSPQSSPHRTRAVAALCEHLNATDTRFPGTGLRLRYGVAGVRGVI